MKDTRGLPGYVLMGIGVVALVVCLASAAMGTTGVPVAAGVVAVVAAAAGSIWVFLERKRIAGLAKQD